MPGADGVVVQQQHLADRRVAHAVVEQHQRIGPPSQTMRSRPVPGQFGQVLPRFGVEEARLDHVVW